MIGTEHEFLTLFFKMNPLLFYGSRTKDSFEFIIDFYDRLQKLGIMK